MSSTEKTTTASLRHAIATMVNEDRSEPGTPERARLVERAAAMARAAEALESATNPSNSPPSI